MIYIKEKKKTTKGRKHTSRHWHVQSGLTTIKDLTISRLANPWTMLSQGLVVHVGCSIHLADFTDQTRFLVIHSSHLSHASLKCLHPGPHITTLAFFFISIMQDCLTWLPHFRMYVCSYIYISRNTQWVLMYTWSFTCLYNSFCGDVYRCGYTCRCLYMCLSIHVCE